MGTSRAIKAYLLDQKSSWIAQILVTRCSQQGREPQQHSWAWEAQDVIVIHFRNEHIAKRKPHSPRWCGWEAAGAMWSDAGKKDSYNETSLCNWACDSYATVNKRWKISGTSLAQNVSSSYEITSYSFVSEVNTAKTARHQLRAAYFAWCDRQNHPTKRWTKQTEPNSPFALFRLMQQGRSALVWMDQKRCRHYWQALWNADKAVRIISSVARYQCVFVKLHHTDHTKYYIVV